MNGKSPHGKASRILRVIYGIYVFLLLAVIEVAFLWLWRTLSRYQADVDEKARQKAEAEAARQHAEEVQRAPQLAFESYMAQADADWWTEEWMRDCAGIPEHPENVASYFKALLEEREPSLYRDASYTDEIPVYKVKFGDLDAARVTLAGNAEEMDWRVADAEILIRGEHSGEIEAPSGARVLCNGIALGAEFLTGEPVSYFPSYSIADDLEAPVLWQTYRAEGLFAEPELAVDLSETPDMVWSEEYGCYLYLAEEEISGKLAADAERFFRAYLNYAMYGHENTSAHLYSCLALVAKDSPAYAALERSRSSMGWAMLYENPKIDLLNVSDPVRWAENCISVDFLYHSYGTLYGVYTDYTKEDQVLSVYFLKNGEDWEIWFFS